MATQYGVKLAVHIVATHFGDMVSKVCECLLRKGTLTLQGIVRFTELSRPQVRNSLLVLIQHNCVQAFSLEQEGGFGEEPKVLTQYMVLFDHIIHRMRFPKFIEAVSKELDSQCLRVFEALLQHGRLTLTKLNDRATADGIQDGVTSESLRRLLDVRYVERCPAAEPHVSSADEDDGPSRKRKLIRKETVEERALAASAPNPALRFSLMPDHTELEASHDDGDAHAGEKRKLSSSGVDCDVPWRPNFEEFLRRLRHKACVVNVEKRLDDGAATILWAILEATGRLESKVRTDDSVGLSLNSIVEESIKREEGRGMTVDQVKASLDELGCSVRPDGLYSVDLRGIVRSAQDGDVESAVLGKYGKDAYRVFRFLTASSRLVETDRIADATFVDKKETAKILHRLWKDDFLFVEKLKVQGAREVDVMLWKVEREGLCARYLDDLYHAALNLCLRRAHEADRGREFLTLPKDKRLGLLKDKYARAVNVAVLLESSLMNLDRSITLFQNF